MDSFSDDEEILLKPRVIIAPKKETRDRSTYQKEYRKKKKATIKKYQADYHKKKREAEDKTAALARTKYLHDYYEAHKEAIKKKAIARDTANPDVPEDVRRVELRKKKQKEYSRLRYEKNKEKMALKYRADKQVLLDAKERFVLGKAAK